MSIFEYVQQRAKTEIEPVMEKVIPKNGEPKELYNLVWYFLNLGGKRLRPVMTLLSCEAVGGKTEDAVYPAVAISLFHNFTLIHDDIEDDSTTRRGAPCLHIRYGIPLAINAGDGLYNFVWKALLESPLSDEKKVKVGRMLNDAFLEVVKGQAMEIGWHRNKEWNITEDDYFRMVGGKTGALMGASCGVGAYVGGADDETVKLFYEFGKAIGLSFQIQDDILNIVGSFEKYKKDIWGDLTEGKRTLMIIKTLEQANEEERKIITETLDAHTNDKEKLKRVVDLMEKYDAINYAKKKAYEIVDNAKTKLITHTEENDARNKLLEIANFFLEREL